MAQLGPHKNVAEYDGAFMCLDCKNRWGALPGHPEAPETCSSLNSDAVHHPSHYNSGKIEVIEAIEDWRLDYHCGNAVKYIARAGKKDPSKEIEDLEKAAWYIKRKIEKLRAQKDGREPLRPNDMKREKT